MFFVFIAVGTALSACIDADNQAEAKRAEAKNLSRLDRVIKPGPVMRIPRGTTNGWALGSFPRLGKVWLTPAEATFFEQCASLDEQAEQILRGIMQEQKARAELALADSP